MSHRLFLESLWSVNKKIDTLNFMNKQKKEQLLAYLEQFITQNKKQKMAQAILSRTRHVTMVLEEVYQSHNASAILRSAECFGVQDVHVVQQRNLFKPKGSVAMGAAKWLSVYSHNTIDDCYTRLKEHGYRIVAATPHEHAHTLQELPLDKKFALVFGTEEEGLTPEALQGADEFVAIPMYGFTESFNVSVSVGICLYRVITQLRNLDIPWRLSEQELFELRLQWARAAVRGSEAMQRRLFE